MNDGKQKLRLEVDGMWWKRITISIGLFILGVVCFLTGVIWQTNLRLYTEHFRISTQNYLKAQLHIEAERTNVILNDQNISAVSGKFTASRDFHLKKRETPNGSVIDIALQFVKSLEQIPPGLYGKTNRALVNVPTNLPVYLKVKNKSGTITIDSLRSVPEAQLESASGNIWVSIPKHDVKTKYDIKTKTGNIYMDVPTQARGDVQAVSEKGDISVRIPDTVPARITVIAKPGRSTVSAPIHSSQKNGFEYTEYVRHTSQQGPVFTAMFQSLDGKVCVGERCAGYN
ncbi:MAG: DUF4097 family beta strand repeat-containing protein [Deinococcaceae bacterium]